MNKTVLIVDDEEVVRLFLRKLCKTLNIDCLEASDVNRALELLSAGSIDLVISDMNMPGETGLHLLQRVRASSHFIPFMILSGSLNNEEEKKLYESGANIVLSKVSQLTKIRSSIQRLLNTDAESVPQQSKDHRD